MYLYLSHVVDRLLKITNLFNVINYSLLANTVIGTAVGNKIRRKIYDLQHIPHINFRVT